jgi:glycosyltransferase 2 family protein
MAQGKRSHEQRRSPPALDDAAKNPAAYVPFSFDLGRHTRWIRLAVLVGVLAFALIFVFADLRELWRTLAGADLRLLSLPLLCVGLSYLTMARSYQGIANAAGYPIPFREMLEITFVANTSNYLISTGGLSGFAVRMYFFTRRGIPSNVALIVSLVQTFMTNVMLLALVVVGFLYLFFDHDLHGASLVVTVALLVVIVVTAVIASLLLLHPRLRRRTLFVLAQTAHRVLHRLWPHRAPARTHIWRYQFNLNRGITFLLARKREMVAPLVYIALDWVFTLLILHSSFIALRYPVSLSQVIVAFAVGMVASFASLIPGGLGVMEGSMAAIFAGFGVPYETAVLATLLFRIVYYVLPLLVSLFFLHGMFVAGRQVGRQLEQGES